MVWIRRDLAADPLTKSEQQADEGHGGGHTQQGEHQLQWLVQQLAAGEGNRGRPAGRAIHLLIPRAAASIAATLIRYA